MRVWGGFGEHRSVKRKRTNLARIEYVPSFNLLPRHDLQHPPNSFRRRIVVVVRILGHCRQQKNNTRRTSGPSPLCASKVGGATRDSYTLTELHHELSAVSRMVWISVRPYIHVECQKDPTTPSSEYDRLTHGRHKMYPLDLHKS